MTSDQLRKTAQELRKIATDHDAGKVQRCAEVIKAAHGLNVLREKVTPNVR